MLRIFHVFSLTAVLGLGLSSLASAADTDASGRMTGRILQGRANGRGDFIRAHSSAERNRVSSQAFAQDDESMSTSSSLLLRNGDRTVGTGFTLTIGRRGTSHGASVAQGQGPRSGVRVQGGSDQFSAEQSARAFGSNAQSRNRAENFRR